MKIAIIGNLTLDEIHKVEFLPKKGEGSLVKKTKIFFGGRAGNIANVLIELGCAVTLYAVAGEDFTTSGYASYFLKKGLSTENIKIVHSQHFARYVIYQDLQGSYVMDPKNWTHD